MASRSPGVTQRMTKEGKALPMHAMPRGQDQHFKFIYFP